MAVRFPDSPNFKGYRAPMRLEGDIRGLEVTQGEVPEALRGTFYRVGADPAWPPIVDDDFYFNADGMVSMFRFAAGQVDFKCRYVRTPRFLAGRAARRSLFGAYRNPYTDDPGVAGINRGLANTNVYWHAGRLLASKEDSPPIQIDPDTLDTVEEWSWHGDLSSQTATAHPKVDPVTGGLVFFGYAAKGETTPDITYYEADRGGPDHPRGVVRGAVLEHGARLGGDAELRDLPGHPADQRPGTHQARRAVLRVGRDEGRLPRRGAAARRREPGLRVTAPEYITNASVAFLDDPYRPDELLKHPP